MFVLPRRRLIGVKLSVALEPTTPDTITNTVLLALDGVIVTETPVTSTNVVLVVLNESVLSVLTTCRAPDVEGPTVAQAAPS